MHAPTADARPRSVRYAGASSTGLVRDHNEDRFLALDLGRGRALRPGDWAAVEVDTSGALLVVADGVGGAAAGEVASRLVTETLESHARHTDLCGAGADPSEWLRLAIADANRLIFESARDYEQLRGMSSTVTAAVVRGDGLWLAQVGDSRAYLLRGGELTQLTEDQTLVREMVVRGLLTPLQARFHDQKNVILQVVGMEPDPEVDLRTARVHPGDRLLLCSDGVTDMLEDAHVSEILSEDVDPLDHCEALLRAANGRGGVDNITAVVCHVT